MTRFAPILLLLAAACAPAGVQPEDCTETQTYTTECSGCGPTDACLDPVNVCAEACEDEFQPCDDDGGMCIDGLCKHNVCG